VENLDGDIHDMRLVLIEVEEYMETSMKMALMVEYTKCFIYTMTLN